jgi:hypothetical protein
VRELVSNASDALEKCRHDFLARGEDPGTLEIAIRTDEERGDVLHHGHRAGHVQRRSDRQPRRHRALGVRARS